MKSIPAKTRDRVFGAPASLRLGLSALLVGAAITRNFAVTEVCGAFTLATEWTAQGSPYLVTGDIFIPADSRLRIGPGVVVRFAKPRPCGEGKGAKGLKAAEAIKTGKTADPAKDGKESQGKTEAKDANGVQASAFIEQVDWADSAYAGIKAEGTFYVLGSEEQPVVFEPDDPKPGAVGWDGIRLSGQQAGAAEISFATFRGANQALTVDRAGFAVHHCLFEGNNTGLYAGLRGDVAVVNCDFIGNFSAGIVIRKAGPRIANSIFAGNRSYGIWADGRPAIQAWNNAFWDNHEEACYKCPYSMLDGSKLNANKDTCDRFGNLAADPVFLGSRSFAAAQESDVETDTPAHLVQNEKMAKAEAKARAQNEKTGNAKAKGAFKPLGKGPYLLSQYSKLVNAGKPGRDFRDRDGSANDIGMHGGPMGRITSDPF